MNPKTTDTDIDTLILLRHGPQRITREYLSGLPTAVLEDMNRALAMGDRHGREHSELVEALLLIYRMNMTYVTVYEKPAAGKLVDDFNNKLAYYLRSYYLHEYD